MGFVSSQGRELRFEGKVPPHRQGSGHGHYRTAGKA